MSIILIIISILAYIATGLFAVKLVYNKTNLVVGEPLEEEIIMLAAIGLGWPITLVGWGIILVSRYARTAFNKFLVSEISLHRRSKKVDTPPVDDIIVETNQETIRFD